MIFQLTWSLDVSTTTWLRFHPSRLNIWLEDTWQWKHSLQARPPLIPAVVNSSISKSAVDHCLSTIFVLTYCPSGWLQNDVRTPVHVWKQLMLHLNKIVNHSRWKLFQWKPFNVEKWKTAVVVRVSSVCLLFKYAEKCVLSWFTLKEEKKKSSG